MAGEGWTPERAREQVVEILRINFNIPPEKITDDASFKKTLGMDSLDIVDFVFFLQKAFGFKSELDEYRDVHTVKLLVEFLVKRAPPPPG